MPLNFDEPCSMEHITCLMDNLQYYTTHGDKEAIQVFRSLLEQTEKQCGSIRRALNGSRSPTNKEPKKTMIGFGNFYEIHENANGSKSLSLPEKTDTKPPILRQTPECLIALSINDKKASQSIFGKKEGET